MEKIPREEVADFLRAIKRGWITLAPIVPPETLYPKWLASNGWKVCVFDDAGCWDYIEWVESSDGRRSEYQDLYPEVSEPNPIYELEPDGDEVETIWHWTTAVYG